MKPFLALLLCALAGCSGGVTVTHRVNSKPVNGSVVVGDVPPAPPPFGPDFADQLARVSKQNSAIVTKMAEQERRIGELESRYSEINQTLDLILERESRRSLDDDE